MTVTALDTSARELLDSAMDRLRTTERIKREAERDAAIIAPKLIGMQIVKREARYVITRVDYSYDGSFTARGYRILPGGKRGSKEWDIGYIGAADFDAAAA